ncbi:MAG: DUF3465 domain-containing protein [Synergistales bacterium]|jgi:hypothetical protein
MAKRLFIVFALLLAAAFGMLGGGLFPDRGDAPLSKSVSSGDEILARLFSERKSSVQVQGSGVVRKVLPDDRDGSRHQRFIVSLATGQTVLVAHNIDQAPRVEGLRKGDPVEFCGEYEWNPQGGVIHWTHRDPSGVHMEGWVRHNGRIYR